MFWAQLMSVPGVQVLYLYRPFAALLGEPETFLSAKVQPPAAGCGCSSGLQVLPFTSQDYVCCYSMGPSRAWCVAFSAKVALTSVLASLPRPPGEELRAVCVADLLVHAGTLPLQFCVKTSWGKDI